MLPFVLAPTASPLWAHGENRFSGTFQAAQNPAIPLAKHRCKPENTDPHQVTEEQQVKVTRGQSLQTAIEVSTGRSRLIREHTGIRAGSGQISRSAPQGLASSAREAFPGNGEYPGFQAFLILESAQLAQRLHECVDRPSLKRCAGWRILVDIEDRRSKLQHRSEAASHQGALNFRPG